MISTKLSACEPFVADLRKTGLVPPKPLDEAVAAFLRRHPGAEPSSLAKHLVDQRLLTSFHAEYLLQGKARLLAVGDYLLHGPVGAGSLGTVYRAFARDGRAAFAVKVLPERSRWNVYLAYRQKKAFQGVRHPAVVPFLDVGTSHGRLYLVWPFVEGESLEAVVGRHGPLRPGLAALYAYQAASGLEACHYHDVFHGLLKPSNLVVGPDHRVRVLDFGIGSLLAEEGGESLLDTRAAANTLASALD